MIRVGKWRRFLAAALCGAGMLTMAAPMAAAVRPSIRGMRMSIRMAL